MGAFTWGVLERLLDAPELRLDVISGTSAGAMNAAMLVQGLATGGPQEAKRLLEAFWRRVAIAAGSVPSAAGVWLDIVGDTLAPVVSAMRQTTAALVPGAERIAANPLRPILAELLDPTVFGKPDAPTLVVAATRVRSGEARLFRDAEVTLDALLASACLPQLFPTVEIDGEAYWDGGYASNPPIRALIEAGAPEDVLIVRTTPLERPEVPTAAASVRERVNEFAFGSVLRQELRSLALVQQLLSETPCVPQPLARLRDARVHLIAAEAEFQALRSGSAQNANWRFLCEMRDLGHKAADQWLRENSSAIGTRSSFDLSRFAQPLLKTDLPSQLVSEEDSGHTIR